MIIGYSFDLTTNALNPQRVQNPGAGREHRFRAWRVQADSRDPVSLKVPRGSFFPWRQSGACQYP
jgi:hypothetical protein